MESFPQGYDEGDHVLPIFSIIQPTSGADKKGLGKEGQFVSKDGTVYDALRFVLISVQYTRGLKRPFKGHNDSQGSSMYFCSSDDRSEGRVADPLTVLGQELVRESGIVPDEPTTWQCFECPHFLDEKNWVSDGCRHGYTMRCWDLERERPFAYFVSGRGVAPIRAVIIDKVTPRPSAAGIVPPERLFWWAELEMETQIREDKGSHYVPVPRVVREHTANEMARYAPHYSSDRSAPVEDIESEETQPELGA